MGARVRIYLNLRATQFSDTFMKRLCQVTRLVEAGLVFVDRPPVSAHSPLTQQERWARRTGHTSSASSSSIVPHPAVARWLTLLCALCLARARAGAREESDGGVAQSTGRLSRAATCPNALTPPA